MKNRKFSLKVKLTVGFVVINFLMLLISGFVYSRIGSVPNELDEVVNKNYVLNDDTHTLTAIIADEHIVLQDYVLNGQMEEKEQLTALQKESKKLEEKISAMEVNKEQRAILNQAKEKTKGWNQLLNEALAEGKNPATVDMEQVEELYAETMKEWEDISHYTEKSLQGSIVNIKEEVKRDLNYQLMATFATLVFTVGIAYAMTRIVLLPIEKIKQHINRLSMGEIHIDPLVQTSKDEFEDLAHAVNTLTHSLVAIVDNLTKAQVQLQQSASQLVNHAEETENGAVNVKANIQQVDNLMISQSERLKEVSVAMVEMAKGIQYITKSGTGVKNEANKVNNEVTEGNRMVQEAVQQIQSLYQMVKESAETVGQLGTMSKNIGNIVEVISNIAEQTNLLSLNASIESARAGEHGRGFAVVADEVKKLSEESKKSASQIAEIIQTIQEQTGCAVESMERGTKEAEKGNELVCEAGEAFQNISNNLTAVNMQMDSIFASVAEISAVADQVTGSVEEMAMSGTVMTSHTNGMVDSSNQQLELMDELRHASQDLNHVSTQVEEAIKQFK